ncbi:hypothetical protein ACFL6S_04090 [Candidatus Poribacteria bacterium]
MISRGIQTAALALILLLCAQSSSIAVSVTGSLTSVAWARENRLADAEDAEENLLLYEYLRFHATNIGSSSLAAHFSGRVGWDRFASSGDGEEYKARLYQGYLDWKLSNKSTLRLGRQFLPNDIGFWQMDGIRLETRRTGFISPMLYAGISVLPWTIKGDSEPIIGFELKTERIRSIRTRLNFLTIFDNEGADWDLLDIRGVDKAILGLQFDTFGEGVIDLLESPHRRLSLFGRGNIDLLTKEIIDGQASAEVRITPKGYVYAEYHKETPLFPADSIFSVFAVEPLRQLTFGVDQDVMSFLGLQGWYARQFFDSDPVNRYSAGFTIERQREVLLAIRLERLDDIDTHYWRAYSHIGKRLWQGLEVSLNNYYNNYERPRALKAVDAYSIQLNVRYRLNHRIQALIRLEDNINPDYKYNVRALGYLQMRFGFDK